MKFTAAIEIMPHKELLDPKGKAVSQNMKNLNLESITNVRIGKHITLDIDAPDMETAERYVQQACKKLLANPVMETYEYKISAV